MNKFTTFCHQYHVTDPFPVSEFLLCAFAAYLADHNLAPQTIKSYLAAIRNTQLSLGLPDPRERSALPILKRVQAGISRARLGRGCPSKVRLPITAHILNDIKQQLERGAHTDRIVLWAVCCTAFFGFFRLGELLPPSPTRFNPRLHLAWGDVAIDNQDNPRMVKFHLKQSKTDQLGKGVDVVVGRTDCALCPVAAILAFIAARGDCQGPLFLTVDGIPLTKPVFIAELRKILAAVGLPQDNYAGHSFRIGAATSAALAWVEDSMIQLLGGWQSSAFLRYVRTPQKRLAEVYRTLATHHQAD